MVRHTKKAGAKGNCGRVEVIFYVDCVVKDVVFGCWMRDRVRITLGADIVASHFHHTAIRLRQGIDGGILLFKNRVQKASVAKLIFCHVVEWEAK